MNLRPSLDGYPRLLTHNILGHPIHLETIPSIRKLRSHHVVMGRDPLNLAYVHLAIHT
jgi:hypothetical protein